jgi:peptidoglycan/xylan/chitin deacetylase (PgdA/CDA1 family)
MADQWSGLIFHGVGAPERELEPGEAPYWISASFFEDILDAVQSLAAPYRVRLSFDDGNRSDHEIALPALLKRNLKADFFVLTGRLGQPGSLNPAQIRALQAAGMGIGSHGIDHRNWAKLDPAALQHELAASRKTLEALCGTSIQTAGVPFGAYNARVLRGLAATGYVCAYTSDGGTMQPDAFLRPRSSVRCDMALEDVINILEGRMGGARSRVRRSLGMMRKRFL